MTTILPLNCHGHTEAECANCGFVQRITDLLPIHAAEQRLTAGEEIPAGECNHCGALAYAKPKPPGRLALEIELENDAFQVDLPNELRRIFGQLLGKLDHLADDGELPLRDHNGNTIGKAVLS